MGCLFFVVEIRQVVHAVVRRLLLVVIRRALHDGRILAHQLGADELADWWAYAEKAFETLVEPDENHDFSIVSVILAAGELEKDVPKRLKKLAHEQQFEGGKHGWGSVRMACVDLEAHKLCVSRMGDSLKNIMKAVL